MACGFTTQFRLGLSGTLVIAFAALLVKKVQLSGRIKRLGFFHLLKHVEDVFCQFL